MAANRDHISKLLGDGGGDAPADAGAMHEALRRSEQAEPQNNEQPGRDFSLGEQRPPQQPERDDQAPPQQPAPQQLPREDMQPDQTGLVPSGRLREETEARRLAEERAKRFEERLSFIQEQITADQEKRAKALNEPEEPNIEEDLQGFVKHQTRRLEEALNEERSARKKLEDSRDQERLINDIKAKASADAQQYMTQAPDFGPAYQWLRDQQIKELEAFGATRQEAVQHLDNQELNFTVHRMRQGQNVAEGFYAQAKARGWNGQQQAPQQQQTAPQQGQQQQQQYHHQIEQQQQYRQPAPVHSQPMPNMQRAVDQNQSLETVPQGGAVVPRDLDFYANMSDIDFMKHAPEAIAMMARELK